MKDRNLHRLSQHFLYVETFGRLDVLQIDPAESRLEQLAQLDDLLGIVRLHFQIKDVDIGKALEQDRLPFHHWLAGQGSDVTQSQYGGAVAHDRHQVSARGVFESVVGILLNLQARFRHSGRVGEAQIALRATRLAWGYFQLSRALAQVVLKSLTFCHGHTSPPLRKHSGVEKSSANIDRALRETRTLPHSLIVGSPPSPGCDWGHHGECHSPW